VVKQGTNYVANQMVGPGRLAQRERAGVAYLHVYQRFATNPLNTLMD
jgi:hypothetical protein